MKRHEKDNTKVCHCRDDKNINFLLGGTPYPNLTHIELVYALKKRYRLQQPKHVKDSL